MNKKLNNVPSAGTNEQQRTDADFSTSASVAANPMLSAALSVEEGNKLIAIFMGERVRSDYMIEVGTNFFGLGTKTLHRMEYHSSWEWLMPVVEKISRIEFHREMQDLGDGKIETIIYTHYPRTFGMLNNETGNPMFRYNSYCLFEAETLIEAAWLATVDFIKTLCL